MCQEQDMTQLELVIAEIEKLPPEEQSQFVAWILEELHAEERWLTSFADSSDILSKLADEALEEYRAKKTQNLDPDAL
jgi:hypothetical protein